jgi:LysM domain-containing protein
VPAGRVLAPVACGHRRAPVPLSLVVALGLAVCLAVIGLGVLANLGSGSPTVPSRTAVVRVEPGENLQELAERVAPGSDPSAVVDRIMELNGLTGASVRAGQPLTVPMGK